RSTYSTAFSMHSCARRALSPRTVPVLPLGTQRLHGCLHIPRNLPVIAQTVTLNDAPQQRRDLRLTTHHVRSSRHPPRRVAYVVQRIGPPLRPPVAVRVQRHEVRPVAQPPLVGPRARRWRGFRQGALAELLQDRK